MKTKNIKIKAASRASFWYSMHIGETFEVNETPMVDRDGLNYEVVSPINYRRNFILVSDCESALDINEFTTGGLVRVNKKGGLTNGKIIGHVVSFPTSQGCADVCYMIDSNGENVYGLKIEDKVDFTIENQPKIKRWKWVVVSGNPDRKVFDVTVNHFAEGNEIDEWCTVYEWTVVQKIDSTLIES